MDNLQNESKTIAVVVNNFTVLLADMDFLQELSILQIRRFAFKKRRLILEELKALYIALWHLSLQRSFPELGGYIFKAFLEDYIAEYSLDHSSDKSKVFLEIVFNYIKMLSEKGDSDFTVPSQHLLTLLQQTPNQTKELKLALHFRNIYTLIFNNLI